MTTDTVNTAADTRNAAGFVSSRRWLLWSGIAALCAWVLVPIYLVALGALGGRQGVYIWPKTGLPTGISLEPFILFLKTEGVVQSFLNSLGAAGITVGFRSCSAHRQVMRSPAMISAARTATASWCC